MSMEIIGTPIHHVFVWVVYVCLWSLDGYIVGRLYWRFYMEEKLRWPNGKSNYMVIWALSLTWMVLSAFIIGELDRSDFGIAGAVELAAGIALIASAIATFYYFRPR